MCSALKDLHGLENWNTEKCQFLSKTFAKCMNLENIDALKNWNTKELREIDYLFFKCRKLPHVHAICNWNLKNCTNYKGLIGGTDTLHKDVPDNLMDKEDIFFKEQDWYDHE